MKELSSSEIERLMAPVTCRYGPCCRVRDHEGSHTDGFEKRVDDVIVATAFCSPTSFGIAKLRELCDALEKYVRPEKT